MTLRKSLKRDAWRCQIDFDLRTRVRQVVRLAICTVLTARRPDGVGSSIDATPPLAGVPTAGCVGAMSDPAGIGLPRAVPLAVPSSDSQVA